MKTTLAIIFLVLLGIILYGLTLRGSWDDVIGRGADIKAVSPGPFEASHERAPYALTYSLAENNSFILTKELADFASPDTVYADNKYFIIFPSGISLIALPFYFAGKAFSLSQLTIFSGMGFIAVLNLVAIFYISNTVFKLPVALSLLTSMIFGFASTSWSFAAGLYQHHMITYFLLLAFISAWKYKEEKRFRWFWAFCIWLWLGAMIWIDYVSVLFMAPIFAYFFLNSVSVKKERQVYAVKFILTPLFTVFSFLLLAGLHGFYNQANFGGWNKISQLLPRYDASLLSSAKSEAEKTSILKAEGSKNLSGVVREDMLLRGLYTLTVASDKGLFFFSPIFIIAVLGIIGYFKKKENRRMEAAVLASIVLINVFFYSSWGDPWGGWAYGPRYLIPSMAVLSIFVSLWLSQSTQAVASRFAALFLFMYSSSIALLGALTPTITPPKVEADFLKIKYGPFFNLDYLLDGKSGSFLYNTFFSHYISLETYFFIILAVLGITAAVLLFINPPIQKNADQHLN